MYKLLHSENNYLVDYTQVYSVSSTVLQQIGIQTCASIISTTVIFQYFLTTVKLYRIYTC